MHNLTVEGLQDDGFMVQDDHAIKHGGVAGRGSGGSKRNRRGSGDASNSGSSMSSSVDDEDSDGGEDRIADAVMQDAGGA